MQAQTWLTRAGIRRLDPLLNHLCQTLLQGIRPRLRLGRRLYCLLISQGTMILPEILLATLQQFQFLERRLPRLPRLDLHSLQARRLLSAFPKEVLRTRQTLFQSEWTMEFLP